MTSVERKETEEELLYQFSQVSTAEQYQKVADAFKLMDDSQFESFFNTYSSKAVKVDSWKEYRTKIAEMRRANGVTDENSALNNVYVKFLGDEDNREIWSEINATSPSDLITLTWDDIMQLQRLWHKDAPDDIAIGAETPADIFFTGSVPLTDVEISVKRGDDPNAIYRIVIFPDYREIIAANEEARVGALILKVGPAQMAYPLYVMQGINGIAFVDNAGHIGLTEEMRRRMKMPISVLTEMAGFIMNVWYGVMIALLHPVVKDVFRKGGRQKEKETVTDARGNKKRIVRYVRRRIVNTDDLTAAITGNGKSRTYHALIWHVVGHWRQLPSGKKTFVKPYWKGALRSLKRNLDDVERQIVLPEEE